MNQQGKLHLPSTSQKNARLFNTSVLIALANLISRALGFAGDAVKSHFFGAGSIVDASNVAAAVPTLLNDLLLQSLVNSAFIPIFSSYEASQEEMWRLSTALLNITTVFFGGVVLLVEAFAPVLVSVLDGGASVEAQTLATNMLRITIPGLLAFNFSATVSTLLYAKQRIVLPAVAGIFLNGTILVTVLLLHGRLGIGALALGLLLGALFQVAIQLYGLRGAMWPYRLVFWHPAIRRIGALFAPILLGLLVEVFISRPFTFAFASQTGEGGIAWMGYALTLRQLPEGLIATALSITVLVKLSAVAQQNTAFRETLAEGLRLALILILPAGVGLFLLAHPITALLFEHGSFTAFDTEVVTGAVRWYVLGLPFATIDLLLVVAFYARHNTLTPALIGLFTTAVYIGLSKALLPMLGLYSLMLGDSIRFALHTVLSIFFLVQMIGGRQEWRPYAVFNTLRQTMLAVVVMGVGVGAASALLPVGGAISVKVLAVFIPVLLGIALYVGMLFLLGTDELRLLNRIWLSVRHR